MNLIKMINMKKNIKGISLAVMVMFLAMALSSILPMLGTALIALTLGVVLRQFMPRFEAFQPGVAWTEKHILETAIILLGFGFQFSRLEAVGGSTFIIIILSIIAILMLALLLQKLTKKEGKLFWLLGAGSAICGSAAIGATAPLIKAKEEETGISLAVINLLGLFGMIILPILAQLFQFDATETGIFLGGILQSAGHVVGASFSVGEDVGAVATIVKMARISLLLPFLLMVYFLFQRKSGSGPNIKFPKFIFYFAVAMIIATMNILPQSLTAILGKSSDVLFNIAMAAIGLKINLRTIWKISGKTLVYGAIIFAFQIVFFAAFLLLR
jgi:uncharacterized integral membrane protein (TIGR00698 family)